MAPPINFPPEECCCAEGNHGADLRRYRETGRRDDRVRLPGRGYKIDLSAEAATDFDTAVAGFVESAEKLGKVAGPSRKAAARGAGPATVDPAQSKAIRDWGRRNGHKVADRGRVPAELTAAYHEAAGRDRTLTAVG